MEGVAELRSIVGDDHVRDGEAADAIDGIMPGAVVRPGTPEEVSAILSLAGRRSWRVTPRGGGTALRIGNVPHGVDLVLDTTRMNRLLEHAAGDLVATMEAGADLDGVQAALAGSGQMLALDGYRAGATVGGVIAANTSGPRRLRFGTVRDLLIGITIVLPDGTIAKAGGKVVKNVAGYDLGKLLTGSLGTLGVIVKAIFRLHPRPAARRLVLGEVRSPDEVFDAVQRVLHSTLVATAIHLDWPDEGSGRIGLLLEGEEPSVAAQAELAREILGAAANPRVQEEAEATAAWEALTATPTSETEVEIKSTCLPTALGEVVAAARAGAAEHGGRWHLSGALGNGILQLKLEESDPERCGALLSALRGRGGPGHVTVVSAPAEVKRGLDVWGPVGNAQKLMERVKDRFDPERILNPGRFVGGI